MAAPLIHLDRERMKRRGEKKMSGSEMLDEFEYLLDAGTHPLLAAQMLGVNYQTLNKVANRHGRNDLFARVDIGAWNRFALPDRTGWGYVA